MLREGRCQATGIEFDLAPACRSPRPWAPSIDRIDPSRGYVFGNVRIVVWAFNQAKGMWTDDVVDRLAWGLRRKPK